jgi:hypothetical protein
MQYRKWARQFYESDAERREPAARLAADGLV